MVGPGAHEAQSCVFLAAAECTGWLPCIAAGSVCRHAHPAVLQVAVEVFQPPWHLRRSAAPGSVCRHGVWDVCSTVIVAPWCCSPELGLNINPGARAPVLQGDAPTLGPFRATFCQCLRVNSRGVLQSGLAACLDPERELRHMDCPSV